jgi:glutamate dehydrogenase (NAD(P)+)
MNTDSLSIMDEWGPEKIVCVSDSRTGMKGVLVIDNTARGMGKGGTRMSPTVTVGEVARLARVMTWKWAGVDLFYGGAKAGIVADPTAPNREEIIRAWARALSNEIPAEYVLGLDMGLTEADAGIVQDELRDRGAAVGSPSELGGIPYDQLGVTGFGVAEATDSAASAAGLTLSGSRVSIQGFGAVGAAAAKRFAELGAQVIAISTVHGALYDPDGLDVPALLDLRDKVGDMVVKEYDTGEMLPGGSELRLPTDILVPAAIQDVIDEDGAKEVTARIVVEGANLPTSGAAQEVMHKREITVIPDFIANAGGVVAAGFAMDARYSAFRPDPQRVLNEISTKLRANTTTVLEEAQRRECTTHAAANVLSQERVRRAMELKGRLRAR